MLTSEYRDLFDLLLDGNLHRIERASPRRVEIAPLMCSLLRVLPEAEGLKLRAAFEKEPAEHLDARIPA
jgi:hypothetical protein